MGTSCDRRTVLEAGGAALAGALAGPVALPAGLDRVLPAPLRRLVPDAARDAAGLIAELLRLEDEARALHLPRSALDFGPGGVPRDPDRLYEVAMPRLVALIDRADARAPILADKAASLLARLHQGEHRVPDQLRGAGPDGALAFPGEGQSGTALGLGASDAPPLPGAAVLPPVPAQPESDAEMPPAPGPGPDPAGAPDTSPPSSQPPASPPPAPEPAAAPLPGINPSHAFADIADEYAAWFGAAAIRPEHSDSAAWHLAMMRQSRPRYAALGRQVGVPWQFVAAIHGLEASFNFRAHLHNGDYPLNQRTRQVPAGRPRSWLPPSSWEASALDALRLMGFAGQGDWSVPRMLYRLEAYNGFGYRHSRRASPYLWSFSTLYSRGKFVADGRFDPAARSRQCGAAVMLKVLDLAGELD